jgi:diguanylate cyclase (GGDEF)-like protein
VGALNADSTVVHLRKILLLILALLVATAASYGVATAQREHRLTALPASDAVLDLAAPAVALELAPGLSPYQAGDSEQSDGSRWYILTVSNSSKVPVSRVLLAPEPADGALLVMPGADRARLRQVASSDGAVTVTREPGFGIGAFRVSVPPGARAPLAIRISDAGNPPSVLAWWEPALVAYQRQLAIFLAVVAGFIATAAAVTGGVAAMTGHRAPRWAGLMLVGLLFVWLTVSGQFDGSWVTALGGPYGLAAALEALALAAGIMLVEVVAPLSDLWPWTEKLRRWALLGLVVLAVAAFVGVPAVALIVNSLLVVVTGLLAAYLVRRGLGGSRAARVLAPSAAVFALVTLGAALAAFGLFDGDPVAAKMVGGFAAAGAVLVALAVAAGEGLGLMGARPYGAAADVTVDGVQATPVSPAVPVPQAVAGARFDEYIEAALTAIGASHQGVYDLDFRTDSLHLSPEAAGLIGMTDGAISLDHSAWLARIHPDDRAIYRDAVADYRSHPGLAFRIEFRVRSESGRYPWFELRATMIGEGDVADRCLGLMADVTTRKESEAAIIDRTLHDPLTGLGNRVALMEALEGMEGHAGEAAFAVLDIDRFKAIHASLGDAGADAVLQHVAARLGKRFAGHASVFRIGGDSFALLFPNGAGDANAIGADLVGVSAAAIVENGRKIFAPASVGVTTGQQAEEPLDLLRNAELALRSAKRQGGGCARVYSTDMDATTPHDAVALETDLRRALDEGQIDVFYQPIMRLSDRSVAGFEALLRWHHPERGLVWPSDFVGHSEETGLIVELGKFALSRAAEDLVRWQHFFPVDPPLFVSVNVSRRQLLDDEFERYLGNVLSKTEAVPGSLRLEVTESAIVAKEHAVERLTRMREMGAGLAIDDFGTGLSSLSQLRRIPFDIVKVDRSFLTVGDGKENEGEVILSSVVTLAHELKRAIIVEGVEGEEDVARLTELGCEYAQGFHFSVPLPAREALNFIALHCNSAAAEAVPEQ